MTRRKQWLVTDVVIVTSPTTLITSSGHDTTLLQKTFVRATIFLVGASSFVTRSKKNVQHCST
jgi:hypothetical protein